MKKLLEIYKDENLLHSASYDVKFFKKSLRDLSKSMYKTMVKNNGVGISAIQVGEPIRMFIVQTEDMKEPLFVVNPKITHFSDEKTTSVEMCLSLPGVRKNVERSNKIEATYLNTFGIENKIVLEGFQARVFQHEYDHLDGILITDKD